LHHKCSVAQVPWPGILCHRHLKWFRWGSGGIFALQLLRCSGGWARDPSSLVPQMAQVGLRWDFCTTVVQVLRWPGTGSVVTGTSDGLGGAQVGFGTTVAQVLRWPSTGSVVTGTSGGSGGAQVGFLHHSCTSAQVAWHGIRCHWYLIWLRWG